MIKENNTANKIGMKKSGEKRQRIKPMSRDYAKEIKEYVKIKDNLMKLSGGKSELSGENPVYPDYLEAHHIEGRIGEKLTNALNIIILTSSEHREIHKHNSYEKKLELLARVKIIREEQGYERS